MCSAANGRSAYTFTTPSVGFGGNSDRLEEGPQQREISIMWLRSDSYAGEAQQPGRRNTAAMQNESRSYVDPTDFPLPSYCKFA